jgi:hypothetical protein
MIFTRTYVNTAGMNRLKIVNASQGIIHQFENVKRKLLFCNADIYFNQKVTDNLSNFNVLHYRWT